LVDLILEATLEQPVANIVSIDRKSVQHLVAQSIGIRVLVVQLGADGWQEHVASLLDSLEYKDASLAWSELLSITLLTWTTLVSTGLDEGMGSVLQSREDITTGGLTRTRGDGRLCCLLGLLGWWLLGLRSERTLVLLEEADQWTRLLLLLLLRRSALLLVYTTLDTTSQRTGHGGDAEGDQHQSSDGTHVCVWYDAVHDEHE
jgi:hypothetical protein